MLDDPCVIGSMSDAEPEDEQARTFWSTDQVPIPDPDKAVARCAWSRPGDSLTDTETDADWRYERDPDHDAAIPGLMRLQNPQV